MELTEYLKKSITVYGASSAHIDQRYFDDAYRCGQLIAEAGYAVCCGGGREGLMKAAIEGSLSRGGRAVGVLPSFMVKKAWQHPELTAMIETPDMHTRKKMMADLSVGCIACPGGCGTFEELMEMITWRQLGLYAGNVVILNTLGYYDPLIAQLERSIEQGYRRDDSTRNWAVAATPEEAINLVLKGRD